MHIALFTRATNAHAASGGMETQTHLLAEGLQDAGHTVVIITTKHPDPGHLTPDAVNGVTVHYVSAGESGKYSGAFFAESANLFAQLHEETPFDVVLSTSDGAFGYSMRLKKKLGVPVVLILHGTLWGEISTFIDKIRTPKDLAFLFLKVLPFGLKTYILQDMRHLHAVDHIIAVSEVVKKQAVKEYFLKEEKVSVVHNGIESEKFKVQSKKSKEIRSTLGFSPSDVVLMYLGRIEEEKGLQHVIDVLPSLSEEFPQVRFMVVGDGPYLDKLKVHSAKLKVGDLISFVGKVPYDEVPGYYAAADVFVFPTMRREGFPMTVIEALAAGLPVVVANSGGAAEAVMDGETGFVIDPGDTGKLEEVLRELLASSSLRTSMSRQASIAAAKRYSVEAMVAHTLTALSRF